MEAQYLAEPRSNYKWYLLFLVVLSNMLLMAIPAMAMSVLAKDISHDLHLSLSQVGIIWGIGFLPGILTGPLAGAMGDRLGPKRVMVVVCLLTGLLGALRGLATGFASMTVIVILCGIIIPFINPNGIKTCGMWFPPHQLGLANGLIAMGMALGFLAGSMLSATVLSPWLGGWRNVFLLYGGLGACLCIPWLFTRPAPPDSRSSGGVGHISIRQALAHVIRLKNIWLLSLAFFGIGGCIQGLLGYLPLYLRNIGWKPLYADSAISAFHTISLIFVIPIALWSNRQNSRKCSLLIAASFIVVGTGLLSLASGAWVWGCVLLAGLVRDGFMAIFTTAVLETEQIGPSYAGTAWGFTLAVSGIGSVLAPPMGNSLAAYWPAAPFAFWAALALLGMLCLIFTRSGVKTFER